MYGHAERNSELVDYLAADRSVRIFHVKRHNLLRRFLSWQRALKTDRWQVKATDRRPENPPIVLSPEACIEDFEAIERMRSKYSAIFQGHECLDIHYEEMCKDLGGSQARALAFLNFRGTIPLRVLHQKTGTEPLSDAIEGYKELKIALADRAEFFDE